MSDDETFVPDIYENHLHTLRTSSLLEMRAIVELKRDQSATKQDGISWDVTLGAIEVELWSRGYGPKHPQIQDP